MHLIIITHERLLPNRSFRVLFFNGLRVFFLGVIQRGTPVSRSIMQQAPSVLCLIDGRIGGRSRWCGRAIVNQELRSADLVIEPRFAARHTNFKIKGDALQGEN